MDIREIKQLAVALRAALRDQNIHADCIVLYGSHAENRAGTHSDIDLAVISRDYGKDRFSEGSTLSRIAVQVHPDIEAVPVGLRDYLAPTTISPILHEIKTKGTPLI
ncbi:MAG: nucleotidyltransferase domain-containing protein [Deltaproteobacteria bacterium]|nr:nucleotidyltransferase domain-containing protein [Deltaproteobacteria bacterium]